MHNKPRQATTTSLPVSMIFRDYTINPMSDAHPRW